MKYSLLTCAISTAFAAALATTSLADDAALDTAFRDALYAEEVKGDAAAALESYSNLLEQLEARRDLHATALYRQAECFRKLGKKDEAIAGFQKILRLYPDVERFQKQAGESLAALGVKVGDGAVGKDEQAQDRATKIAAVEKMLLESPDQLNSLTKNLLAQATQDEDIELVKFLISKGAKPNVHGLQRQPLEVAARLGNKVICEYLLDRGANVQNDENGALAGAIDQSHSQIMKLLLAKGADPNGKCNSKVTGKKIPFLEFALQEASPEVLQLLLEAAPVGKDQSSTLLRLVVGFKDIAKLKLLLEAGADPKAVDGENPPLLHSLLLQNASSVTASELNAMITLLVAKGADWKQLDSKGNTAIHAATLAGWGDWVKKIVQAGVDVNAKNKLGQTALHQAAAPTLPVLIALGANPNLADNEGNTPLHTRMDGIEELLTGKADMGVQNLHGLTPLDVSLAKPKKSDDWEGKLLSLARQNAPAPNFPVATSANEITRPSPLYGLFQSDGGREAFRLLTKNYLDSRRAERPTGVWFSMGVATGLPNENLAFFKMSEKTNEPDKSAKAKIGNPLSFRALLHSVLQSHQNYLQTKAFERVLIHRPGVDGKDVIRSVNVWELVEAQGAKGDISLQWGDILSLEDGKSSRAVNYLIRELEPRAPIPIPAIVK
jgi:ankyrin repeat protein